MTLEINSDWFVEIQAGRGRPLQVIDASYIAPDLADDSSDMIYAIVPGNPERGDHFVIQCYDPRAVISHNTARFIDDLAKFGYAYSHTTPKFLKLLENLRIYRDNGEKDVKNWLKNPALCPVF